MKENQFEKANLTVSKKLKSQQTDESAETARAVPSPITIDADWESNNQINKRRVEQNNLENFSTLLKLNLKSLH